MDVNACNGQANCIHDQVNANQDLADDWNLDAVTPTTKSMDNDGEGSKLEQWRDTLAKESHVLRPHAIAANFPFDVGPDGIKHDRGLIGLAAERP
jgi:hypothetical protein